MSDSSAKLIRTDHFVDGSGAAKINLAKVALSGIIAYYEVTDPSTGAVSEFQQVIGRTTGGTIVLASTTDHPNLMTTFSALVKTDIFKGLLFGDNLGTAFDMPVGIRYGNLTPDPSLQLTGPVIGFSVKESALSVEGFTQVEVITNDCPCPASTFIPDASVPSEIVVVYSNTPISTTILPAHQNTMASVYGSNCGAHTWSLSPTLPIAQFTAINADGSAELKVETTDILQVGSYSTNLIVM